MYMYLFRLCVMRELGFKCCTFTRYVGRVVTLLGDVDCFGDLQLGRK